MSTGKTILANAFHSPCLDGYASGSDVITSAVLNVQQVDNLSLQVEWTDGADGTLAVLASNNYDSVQQSGTFHPYLPAPTIGTQPSGTAGGEMIVLTNNTYKYVQLQFTSAGEGGTVTCWANGRSI